MAGMEAIDMLSKKYSMSRENFIKFGSTLALKEKKLADRKTGNTGKVWSRDGEGIGRKN